MAIGDFYRTSAIYSHPEADGDVVNILDYEQQVIVVSKTEGEFCNELAAEVRNTLVSEFLPLIADDWQLDKVDCFNITQPTFQGVAISGANGGLADDSVAVRSAIVVTKRTALRGRSFLGRTFLPAPPETVQDGGRITSIFQLDVDTAMAQMISLDLSNGNEYELVVFSELLVSGEPVTSYAANAVLGSVRGRQKV